MAFIGAYFDASYDGKRKVTAVGGIVSTVEQWERFNKQWKEVAVDAGFPFFHMSDFENGEGFFKNWSLEKKHAVLNKLLEIIIGSRMFCTITRTINEEFEVEKKKRLALISNKELKGKMRRFAPYNICGENSVAYIYRYASKQGFKNDLEFCFERGGGEKPLSDAVPLWDYQQLYKNVSIRSKCDVPALQAADIVAYEGMKSVSPNFVADGQRYPFRRLAEKNGLKIHISTPKEINKFFDAWIEFYSKKQL